MLKRLILLATLLATANFSYGQRISRTINESWSFLRECDDAAVIVNLPHTWNNLDAQDENPGYFRGKGKYNKTIRINEDISSHSFFLHFEGANQTAEISVNGKSAGKHEGGYTAFCFDISDLVKQGDNLVEVTVDNTYDENIPPLSADFTFFGGIYRDVTLIITPKVHISTTNYATSGVYITTSDEDKKTAVASIRTYLSNDSETDNTVMLTHTIVCPDGKTAATKTEKIRIKAGAENICHETSLKIDNPVLWSIDSPKTYSIMTCLADKEGRHEDAVSNSFGIRWFEFNPNKGFSINGQYTKLIGTNRHQDYYLKGNALPDEMHVRDVRMLKEMGGNFLRIAHYPQDPVITQMCDRYGIVASVEIPVVNAVTISEVFRKNCVEMTKEMIWQDYNSPSVVMWAYMNEVMLRPPYDKNNQADKKTYMEWLFSVASDIEDTIRELDPKRYSMIPCHSNSGIYDECGISKLPMILGWNLYNGWYSNGFEGFEKALDKLHARYPDQSILVTEYGADVDPRLHSFDSERFDFTCEYGLRYHHHYISKILERKWLAGTTVWNINDFYSEGRQDAVPRINNKGITGINRERKDSYHLYKTWLSEKPTLTIGGHTWKIRGGNAGKDGFCYQPVEVYTNAAETELFINGKSLGKKTVSEMTAIFEVPFSDGENIIEAIAEKDGIRLMDMQRIDFRMLPYELKDCRDFVEMNVMLGSKRYFEDREAEMIWIPEQQYRKGSWGYIGGESSRTKTRHGSLPCSDVDILNTCQDPIFQTQRKGLNEFRVDVPDGQYYVYLYFAELVSEKTKEALAYNLGNDSLGEQRGRRIFNVSINGRTVLKNFDIAEECGEETAVIKKFTVDSFGKEGISIKFTPVEGEPVLNAVRIYKCH